MTAPDSTLSDYCSWNVTSCQKDGHLLSIIPSAPGEEVFLKIKQDRTTQRPPDSSKELPRTGTVTQNWIPKRFSGILRTEPQDPWER